MYSKILLAIPLALLLFAGMHQVGGVGEQSSSPMLVHAQSLNTTECEYDCRFRYNIRTGRCDIPILPTDTPRRIGYEKCLAECQRQATAPDESP